MLHGCNFKMKKRNKGVSIPIAVLLSLLALVQGDFQSVAFKLNSSLNDSGSVSPAVSRILQLESREFPENADNVVSMFCTLRWTDNKANPNLWEFVGSNKIDNPWRRQVTVAFLIFIYKMFHMLSVFLRKGVSFRMKLKRAHCYKFL